MVVRNLSSRTATAFAACVVLFAAMSPPRAVVASPSGCVPADAALVHDTRSAFAYVLPASKGTHFLTEIAAASPSAVHTVLGAIVLSTDTSEFRRVDAVLDTVCPTLSDFDAEARADRLVSKFWKLDGFTSRQKLNAIMRAVEDAVFALDHSSEVAETDATTILSPFAAIAVPVRPPTEHCSKPNVDATMDRAVYPDYSKIAAAAGSEGMVTLSVTLTADGDVSSIVLVKNDTSGILGRDALVEASIMAAAGSTYHPSLVNCVGQAGSYPYRAQFAGD